MKYISYIEICVGLGLGLGPVLGSLINKYLSYEGTMYIFAAMNGVATLVCMLLIPNVLNKSVK